MSLQSEFAPFDLEFDLEHPFFDSKIATQFSGEHQTKPLPTSSELNFCSEKDSDSNSSSSSSSTGSHYYYQSASKKFFDIKEQLNIAGISYGEKTNLRADPLDVCYPKVKALPCATALLLDDQLFRSKRCKPKTKKRGAQ